VLVVALGAGLAGTSPAAERRYLADGVYQEDDELRFERPEGPARERLDDWRIVSDPTAGTVGLAKREDSRIALRLVDRAGEEIGTLTVPAGREAFVTEHGVITLPEAPHAPVRAHDITFLGLHGEQLGAVSDPTLMIIKWWIEPDGRLVTLNQGVDSQQKVVLAYGPTGNVLWRHEWRGADVPDVILTPDNRRLLLVRNDVTARTSNVTVLDPANQVVRQVELPLATEVVASPDGQRVAAVGWGGAFLLDARSGDTLWRREDVRGVLPKGVRFDPRGKRLLVVEGRPEDAATMRLGVRSLRLRDGASSHADLGTAPRDRVPAVREIRAGMVGDRRVVLADRVVSVAPGAWRRP
jgi:hypothetical protein